MPQSLKNIEEYVIKMLNIKFIEKIKKSTESLKTINIILNIVIVYLIIAYFLHALLLLLFKGFSNM